MSDLHVEILPENFDFDGSVISFPAFPSRTNLKLHKKVISNLIPL